MTTVIYSADSASPAPLSLAQIVEMTGGELLPLTGSGSNASTVSLKGAAPPAEAKQGEATMVDQVQHAKAIRNCRADVLITPQPLTAEAIENEGPAWQIVVDNPHQAFAEIILYFRPPVGQDVPGTGVDSTAIIHPSAQVSAAASIGAGVVIGPGTKVHAGVSIAAGCTIGAECVLYPNVTLYSYCRIGDRVVIHAGSTLGAHGFGYRNVAGKHVPTSQLGYVQIDNDVELGASVTIDRGTYGATRIGEGTKIDNQVMIGHNCRIGKHNLLCSQVGIAGSCTTGDYVVLAGQVGLRDHIHLGDHVTIGAQAGVMDNLTKGVYFGSPATPQPDQLRMLAVQRKLPDLRRELKELQSQVRKMMKQNEGNANESSSKAA
ncbi:UDP-3-O-(3-hydroxymyristoyl)glucosamine N-acyltransferase [Aporhodopirellula aestuarii]|uniref:UDP-3-O-acylglucosamine N-acyltransferase n=1 Tax=Aporhodopirellula aestuarii TaxID=2950107 RepID=A0ABT0U7F3_9BACT|nr:UDP-3-O-(3-hydroxymyristoyl)glucosamine N-acyltransferase [Aporhodopirellula aestuarii]MCM2372811.1 UDP-3-O-(3-hydroxymyristoyl)glucosamine N-acyltransferase [Aporhodopirellula aestuarii]